LEASLESCVLLDVFAELVEGGGADALELASRQSGLEHVGGIHGPLCRSGSDNCVQLVDEQDDLALGGRDLVDYRLEALLELAAELRARHESAHVQRHDALVAQHLGDVLGGDLLSEPFGDRRLAHAWLADEDRVVLRSAR